MTENVCSGEWNTHTRTHTHSDSTHIRSAWLSVCPPVRLSICPLSLSQISAPPDPGQVISKGISAGFVAVWYM